MDMIRSYIDTIFSNLPQTSQTLEVKNNLLTSMETKYCILIEEGKSEHEAIGTVISEFSHMDELLEELRTNQEQILPDKSFLTREETYSYLSAKRQSGLLTSLGTLFCIISPAPIIFLSTLLSPGQLGPLLGLCTLFVLVAIAVVLFIISAMQLGPYQYVKKGVHLPPDVCVEIQQMYDSYKKSSHLSIGIGVGIIIVSPISLIMSVAINSSYGPYGLSVLLLMVAIAIVLFISTGFIKNSYEQLLLNHKVSVPTSASTSASMAIKKENNRIGLIRNNVWSLATLCFLFLGFVFHLWKFAWIIYPTTAILLGIYDNIVEIATGKKKED